MRCLYTSVYCCGLHGVCEVVYSNHLCCVAVSQMQVVLRLLEEDPPDLQLFGCGLLIAFDDWGCQVSDVDIFPTIRRNSLVAWMEY